MIIPAWSSAWMPSERSPGEAELIVLSCAAHLRPAIYQRQVTIDAGCDVEIVCDYDDGRALTFSLRNSARISAPVLSQAPVGSSADHAGIVDGACDGDPLLLATGKLEWMTWSARSPRPTFSSASSVRVAATPSSAFAYTRGFDVLDSGRRSSNWND
jgi:hypothetical protein